MWIALNWILIVVGLLFIGAFIKLDTYSGIFFGFAGVIVLFIGMASSLLAWLHLN
jgi:hypothetical protein